MTKEREALKLALEALEGSIAITMAKIALRNEAITAVEKMIAQPEQGLVDLPAGKRLILVDSTFDELINELSRCECKGHLENCSDLVEPWENLAYEEYTTPPKREWVGLSAKNKEIVLNDRTMPIAAVLDVTEAKLKELNA